MQMANWDSKTKNCKLKNPNGMAKIGSNFHIYIYYSNYNQKKMSFKESNSEFAIIKQHLESNEIGQAISTAKSLVEHFLESNLDEDQEKLKPTIDGSLPLIFKHLFNLDKHMWKFVIPITEFIQNYVSLIIKLDLHEKLLAGLCDCVHNYEKEIITYSPVELSVDETKQILQSFTDKNSSILQKDTDDISLVITNTIKICFTTGLFTTTIDKINDNLNITNTQLALMFKLFTSIEPYLLEDIVFCLLPYFADAIIQKISDSGEDFEDMAQQLTVFFDMLPEKQNSILKLLCSLVFVGPVKKRFSIITEIKNIVERKNLTKKNLVMVKETLLKAVSQFQNDDLIKQVLDFLPSLAEKTSFTEDELSNILTNVHASIELVCSCLTNIIPSMNGKVQKFANFLYEKDIYSPELICLLISQIKNKKLCHLLFERLLKPPQEYSINSLAQLEMGGYMTDFIEEAMDDTEDPDIICALSKILLNMELPNNYGSFVIKIINMSQSNESLISALEQFHIVLDTIDSKSIVYSLFDTVFDHYEKKINIEYLSRIIPVLTLWISSVSYIQEDSIYKRLEVINFSDIPPQMPKLISSILQKTKKASFINDFLFKIIEDTVPRKYSSWAINTVFDFLHGDKKAIKKILNMLIDHLHDERRNNALYMIQRAAQYEADFFRLGEEYSNIFRVSIIGSKKIDFNCSLHPYHTCRRVYAEATNRLKIPVDQFQLSATDKMQSIDRLIISSTPISEIIEISISRIRLAITVMDTGVTNFHVKPLFLESLQNNPDSIQELFDLLNDESLDVSLASVVLEILQLFQPLTGKEAVSPLQKILLKSYDKPLSFADNNRIFPSALSSYELTSMSVEDFTQVINIVIDQSFDKLSAAVLSKAISRIECPDFVFSPDLIKKGFIINKHKSLRTALLRHFNQKSEFPELITLIPLVCEPTYRERSKEFLSIFKKCNFPPEDFIPFYKDLKQFETSNNVDQTFISLLQLIPKNEEMIKLTYDRLAISPTVKNPQNPFVHSEKARVAAFNFITTDAVYPILSAHLNVIPEYPTTQKLSEDFTFQGRNGITNLGSTCYINTLMQSLNTITNFTNRILSLPTDGLSQFMRELRGCLAQLRYYRNYPGSTQFPVSTEDLINTFPNFNAFSQEDAQEFLLTLINRVLEELKEDSEIIKQELELKVEISTINEENKVLNSREDTYFVLPLPIKDLSHLFQSFQKVFSDEVMKEYFDGNEKKKVILTQRVKSWPNYLFIQLQRFDFKIDQNLRVKLVHEFGFPIEFSTNDLENVSKDPDPITYRLSAVIVHEGDVESGHYFAIVNGEDGEWYKCDDADVQSFDVANIPAWSFGIPQNDQYKANMIWTAYLLFYQRVDTPYFKPTIPEDLENQINSHNEKEWPPKFFFSQQFLNFAQKLTSTYQNELATEIAFTAFFKIAIANDFSAKQWRDHIIQNFLTSPEKSMKLFDFIKTSLGKFSKIVDHSDFGCECIKTVVFSAFSQLPNTTKPLYIILNALEYSIRTRVFTFAFELISLAFQNLNVSWEKEDDVLRVLVKYFASDMKSDFIRSIKAPLSEATEYMVKTLSNVVLKNKSIETVSILFQSDVLERLLPILSHSESFQKLAINARSLNPALISSIGETTGNLSSLLAPIGAISYTETPSEKTNKISVKTDFTFNIISKLAFSPNKKVRENICETICEIMDRPDRVVENYITNRIFENDLICPEIIEESSFLDLLASLITNGIQNLSYFDEYSNVLIKLSLAAPIATSLYFDSIIQAVPSITNKDVLVNFLIVVKHLVAFDDSLREKVPLEVVNIFLKLDYGFVEALQFVALFPQNASGSNLFAACVTQSLDSIFTDISFKIIDMIKNGMNPGYFKVPESAKDPMNILIALTLFEHCTDQKDDLKNYILYILKHLKPIETTLIEPFSTAIKMIEDFYHMSVKELMD